MIPIYSSTSSGRYFNHFHILPLLHKRKHVVITFKPGRGSHTKECSFVKSNVLEHFQPTTRSFVLFLFKWYVNDIGEISLLLQYRVCFLLCMFFVLSFYHFIISIISSSYLFTFVFMRRDTIPSILQTVNTTCGSLNIQFHTLPSDYLLEYAILTLSTIHTEESLVSILKKYTVHLDNN